MIDVSENDLNQALIQLYQKNNQENQQKRSSPKDDNDRRKQAYQRAETEFLARKVIEPCSVKEIRPFPITQKQEDILIPEFIRSPHGELPTEHTMAMEGNPYTVLVQMKNGLVYMAAISQVMSIRWPGGIQNEIHRKMEKASDGLITFDSKKQDWRPIIQTDTRQYHIQLYPMHLNKDIQQHDYLGVLWQPTEDITDPKIRPGLAFPAGGESFQYLTDFDGICIREVPPHIRQMIKQVQILYDQARSEKKIGKPVYARFDPDKPMAGRGWTMTVFPWEKRQYFDVPSVKYINPNRKNPLRIIHQSVPKISRQNIHE